MKRYVISLLIMSMVTFVGCSSNTGGDNANNTTKTESSQTDNNIASKGGTEASVLDSMPVNTPDEVIARLKKGNELYVSDKAEKVDTSNARRAELEKGQNPFAVVLSCSDSRVVSSLIFNTGLGEIFDIKLAGNVVDDFALGSIEYGVEHLGVPVLVVMGHESCGAVTAAYDEVKSGAAVEGNIELITEKIKPVVENSTSIEDAARNNVHNVIKTLENDEIIKHLVDQGKLKIVGAYYDLDGHVEFLS